MKKIIFLLSAFCFLQIIGFAQNPLSNFSQKNDVVSNFKHFSMQQLLDTAKYYVEKNSTDTALVCYSLIINNSIQYPDIEQQKIIIEAYNKASVVYYYMCDYRKAYEFLIKALILCEKTNYVSFEHVLYTNLGNIYYHFKKYDVCKSYYLKALSLSSDTTSITVILNNLGSVEMENEHLDSAHYYFDKSLQISKQHNNTHAYSILNNMAQLYQKEKQYDSALYYFQLSLNESKINNKIEKEAYNLSGLSKLFFEINKTDSAIFYIDLSNIIATENNFLGILSDNYLTLSKIEETKGHIKMAFEHYKKYASLKDSVFNTENFGDINQLQRLYEVSKTNQQIEQLVIEQQIKEHTIKYQRVIQFITLFVLLLVSIAILIFFFQKRNLNFANKILVEKNHEIMELLQKSSELKEKKNKKNSLNDDINDELLHKILTIMEDTQIICDPEFSMDTLVVLVHSNQKYVSHTINTILNKNFRSFLNNYRIREAQRLFSEPNAAIYTIESVALKVGFKSRTAFRDAFKETTGVSPNVYFKAMLA